MSRETPLKLLILGGTTEASALARALAGDARFDATLSLAGVTRNPVLPPIAHRIGGFGGVAGLVTYLRKQGIDVLIDATHPFAAVMSHNAAEAARKSGVRFLAVRRPEWNAVAGDRWTHVPDIAAAVRALGAAMRRVFLTIGQKELAAFRAAPQHSYLVRSVDPPDADSRPPQTECIAARGPFTVEDDRRLLEEHRIDVLVTKNSGGSATASKLTAARELGLAVVMVDRPEAPEVETVADVPACLAWLTHQTTSAPARRGV